MNDLRAKLARLEFVGIPVEFLTVMKRNPKFNQSSVDLLSQEKSLEKQLSKLKVNDGVNLFVEDSRVPHPDSLEYEYLRDNQKSTKWETEFELEKNRFTIKYNSVVPVGGN